MRYERSENIPALSCTIMHTTIWTLKCKSYISGDRFGASWDTQILQNKPNHFSLRVSQLKFEYLFRLDALSSPSTSLANSIDEVSLFLEEDTGLAGFARLRLRSGTGGPWTEFIGTDGRLRRDLIKARVAALLAVASKHDVQVCGAESCSNVCRLQYTVFLHSIVQLLQRSQRDRRKSLHHSWSSGRCQRPRQNFKATSTLPNILRTRYVRSTRCLIVIRPIKRLNRSLANSVHLSVHAHLDIRIESTRNERASRGHSGRRELHRDQDWPDRPEESAVDGRSSASSDRHRRRLVAGLRRLSSPRAAASLRRLAALRGCPKRESILYFII
ncbi:unnamed protein product [Trichogramma brassicae]|uniref:Uncharacterized protein n=1 Tax=Trichogramma brassicae TaxID=86971 RepID=A0A6H5HWE4_9HYME|nr:unnamed protein product [Trichogramma brassicae]